ncbi:hypothetical protein [Bacillus sp. EB600]|nr:hypothetical protein [Bacillus sp. EB600]MCQ6280737.1 hypothetical protein [Bacillus sp. EB600]
MEQVCTICASDNKNLEKDGESSVLIICENCLRNDIFPPLLDKYFLN